MHSCVEDTQLKQFWKLEADPVTNKKPILTEEEIRCEKFFAETTARDSEGRYIVRLPFSTEEPESSKYKEDSGEKTETTGCKARESR